MATQQKVERIMTSVRETKGTFVFQDKSDDNLTLRTVYLPKAILNAIGAKGDVKITIEPAD